MQQAHAEPSPTHLERWDDWFELYDESHAEVAYDPGTPEMRRVRRYTVIVAVSLLVILGAFFVYGVL